MQESSIQSNDEDQIQLLVDDQKIESNSEKEITYEKEITHKKEIDQEQEIAHQKDNHNNSNQETFTHQNIEEKPLDLWQMIIQGNFDIILNYDDLIGYNEIGPQGFGLVHYLATYNRLEGLQLIKSKGAKLDLESNGKQTALSIACHYGFIEIVKYLIDSGCSVYNKNNAGMTPLAYAIKNKKYPIIFYLLTKENNLEFSDNNGGSLVHLSASENDVLMMRFYKATQVIFDLYDKSGQTPLIRAISNCAIDVVKYLLRHNPDLINFALDSKIINTSPMIKKLIAKASFDQRIKLNDHIQKITSLLSQWHKFIILTFFILIILLELIFFILSDVQRTLNDGYGGLLLDIGFIIGLLYSIFYIVWFMVKTTDHQTQGEKILQRRINQNHSKLEAEQSAESSKSGEEQKKYKKAKSKKYQINQTDLELMPQNLSQQEEQTEKLLSNEGREENVMDEDDDQEDEEEIDEKSKFLLKIKQEQVQQKGFYEIDITPFFLEGITLKDFLSINYKPVEDFIDTMKNKPSYYFKFAQRIGQFKEEINALLEINDPLWYNGFTIIHLVYFLFETNRFKLIHRINWDRICFTCLSYKLPRTYHCVSCNQCIKDFHFHSKLLGKCINSTNHFFFLILIVSFTILVNLNILFTLFHYYDEVKSIFIMLPNIFFIIAKKSIHQSLIFIFNLWVAYFLNYQLMVEVIIDKYIKIVCVVQNMTQNELFNSHRYKYFYKVAKQSNGSVFMTQASRLQAGIMVNCFNFIKNSFRNLKLL